MVEKMKFLTIYICINHSYYFEFFTINFNRSNENSNRLGTLCRLQSKKEKNILHHNVIIVGIQYISSEFSSDARDWFM